MSPLERIERFDPPCMDPQHNPPNCIVLEPGRYRHTCPRCGRQVEFDVPAVYCGWEGRTS